MKDICGRRHRGSETSRQANERVAPHKNDLQAKIMEWFFKNGPATCEQAATALEMRYTTASARISELKAKGLLAFTGERRKTSGGSYAAVLRVNISKPAPVQRGLFQ
jgi:predicted HTH transcriptional regulator